MSVVTKFNKPIILASNEDRIEKGQKIQDFEISVGVLPHEINQEEPTFYPYRAGRIYDPNDFKPIGNGNVLPQKLRESYYMLLSEARTNLPIVRNEMAGQTTPGKKEGETVEINQLKTLVQSQEQQIKELLNTKDHSEEMQKLKELLQAKTKEIEALKAGETNEVRHYEFDDIVAILEEKIAVYLYGPAGTGKSALAKQIAKHLKLNFYPMSTITQEFKFTGYKDGNGLYHDTNFYKAVKDGGVFFIDEMDSCSSDVLVGLNACLANGYFDFPHETIDCHKDFVVISAGNTTGHGANADYVGRQQLDLSTLDRFMAVRIDYDINIDMAVTKGDKELVDFAHALRKASQETEITILMSYRALTNITKLKDKFDLVKLMDRAVTKGMASDDIHMLAQNVKLDSTNKYLQALKKVA
jgi:AAA domain (dynein-related subfamily)